MRIPHELQDEFPDETVLIARLTKANYLFRRLASQYDEINRQIYRIESEEEPTTDEVLERLKKTVPQAKGPDCRHVQAS